MEDDVGRERTEWISLFLYGLSPVAKFFYLSLTTLVNSLIPCLPLFTMVTSKLSFSSVGTLCRGDFIPVNQFSTILQRSGATGVEWGCGCSKLLLLTHIDFLDVLGLRETRPYKSLRVSVLLSVFVPVISLNF